MRIQESIANQVIAGYSESEIITNLHKQGYSTNEIEEYLESISILSTLREESTSEIEKKKSAKPNIKLILYGILILVLGIIRLVFLSSTSNFNAIVGSLLILAGLATIFVGFFTKK